jgi:hypothetical protein
LTSPESENQLSVLASARVSRGTIRDGAGNNAVLTSANGYTPAGTLALLWQKFSQGYAELNHLRQCGQREGRARVM